MKFKQPASRFALVGVFVAQTAGGVRVAVTGAGPGVFRVKALEDTLAAKFAPESCDGVNGAGDRAEHRPARVGRVPRAPDHGDGQAGGRRSWPDFAGFTPPFFWHGGIHGQGHDPARGIPLGDAVPRDPRRGGGSRLLSARTSAPNW